MKFLMTIVIGLVFLNPAQTEIIKSYNGQTKCEKYKRILAPDNISQLQRMIRDAFVDGNSLRFLGSRHSANSIICGDGDAILTNNFNKIIGIGQDQGQAFVEVESGVKIGDLADYLDQKGYTLGYAYPYYREVTIGGVLGTGAHGTSFNFPASISSIVSKIEFVDGTGELKTADKESNSDLLRALRINLGVLGFIYKVQIPVQLQFNISGKLSFESEDDLLNTEDGLERIGRSCEHVFLAWFPHQSEFVKYCGSRTTNPARKGAQNVFLDDELTDQKIKIMKLMFRQGRKIDVVNCSLEKVSLDSHKNDPKIVGEDESGKLTRVLETIAPSHRLLQSRSPNRDDLFVLNDFSLVFDLEKGTNVLREFKKIMLEESLCFPTVGINVRFMSTNDESLVGSYHLSGPGPKVVIEFFDYLDLGTPKKNARVDAFARMIMIKYEAFAHWGKNKDWQFPISVYQSDLSIERMSKFKEIQKKLDPKGIFINSFYEKL